MDRRSWIRPVRAIVVVCAVSALTVLPSAAHGAAPVQGLGEVQRTVGQAVSQAVDLTKPALRPATPAPAPTPAAPAPAPRAASPAPAAAPQPRPAPVRQARAARAGSSQNGDSPARAAQEAPSPPPAPSSSATQPADSSAAPAATPRTVFATAADLGTGDDETSLPFTGSNMLPLLLVAALALLTGIGLNRAVRTG